MVSDTFITSHGLVEEGRPKLGHRRLRRAVLATYPPMRVIGDGARLVSQHLDSRRQHARVRAARFPHPWRFLGRRRSQKNFKHKGGPHDPHSSAADCVIREGVTNGISAAITDRGATLVGDNCYFMNHVHYRA